MAVRRPRRRPQAGSFGGTAVAPGGPFAEEELALDLLLPGSTAAGNSTNGGGGGQPAQQQQQLVPLEVTWLRRRGDRVCKEQELASVRCRLGRDAGGPEVVRKLLSPRTGTLEEALVPSPLPPLDTSTTDAGRLVLGKVVYCSHPCLRDDRMCAVCGEVAADLGHAHHGAGGTTRVFVKGGHHVSVSMTEAASLYRSMAEQLQKARKLHLVLDIDLTLLHATIDPRAQSLQVPAALEVHSFDVMSFGRPLHHWCCLRPGLRRFLEAAKGLYVLSIYTHGRRDYAHQVAKLLDPDKALFGERIVSRDDCPDLHGHKSLQRLFPGGIEMALILDDSPQVWQGEQSRHLLPVLPFKFYTEFEELNRVQGMGPAPTVKVFGDPKEDTQLQHTLRVLQEVHRLYYPPADAHEDAQPPAAAPSQQRPKNVASCLAAVRRPCLAGCSLVFSGLVPRGVDPRKTDLGYMATALGATVTEALAEGTTHVVAENPSTEKVYHARQRTGARAVHIVTRVWLQLSFWHCERKPEADFPLLAPPKVGRDGKDAAVPVVPPAPTAAAPAGAAPATVEVREAEEGPVSKRAKIEVSEERVEEKEKAEGGGGKEEDGSPRVPTVMAETAAAAVTAATIKDGGAEEEEEDEDWAAALADELG